MATVLFGQIFDAQGTVLESLDVVVADDGLEVSAGGAVSWFKGRVIVRNVNEFGLWGIF